MRHFFQLIALLLGAGQSQAKNNDSNVYNHYYLNDKEVSKEEYFTYTNPKPVVKKELTKLEFVTMMRVKKNIICL